MYKNIFYLVSLDYKTFDKPYECKILAKTKDINSEQEFFLIEFDPPKQLKLNDIFKFKLVNRALITPRHASEKFITEKEAISVNFFLRQDRENIELNDVTGGIEQNNYDFFVVAEIFSTKKKAEEALRKINMSKI